MILRRMDSDRTGLSYAVGSFAVSSSVTCRYMCVSSCTTERQSHLPGHHRGFLQARRTASQSVPFFILQMSAPHLHGPRACLGIRSAFGQGSRYMQGCDPTLDKGETSCL